MAPSKTPPPTAQDPPWRYNDLTLWDEERLAAEAGVAVKTIQIKWTTARREALGMPAPHSNDDNGRPRWRAGKMRRWLVDLGLRTETGARTMTMKDIAAASGATYSTVQKWHSGERRAGADRMPEPVTSPWGPRWDPEKVRGWLAAEEIGVPATGRGKLGELVSMSDIAVMLGVEYQTVKVWNSNRGKYPDSARPHPLVLPEPLQGRHGRRQVWARTAIEEWAKQTERLTGDNQPVQEAA